MWIVNKAFFSFQGWMLAGVHQLLVTCQFLQQLPLNCPKFIVALLGRHWVTRTGTLKVTFSSTAWIILLCLKLFSHFAQHLKCKIDAKYHWIWTDPLPLFQAPDQYSFWSMSLNFNCVAFVSYGPVNVMSPVSELLTFFLSVQTGALSHTYSFAGMFS